MENIIIEKESSKKPEIIKKKKKPSSRQFNYFKCLKCTDYISLNINPHNFSVSYECDNGDIEEDLYFSAINQFISQNKYEEHIEKNCANCSLTNNNCESQGLEYFAYCKMCKIHLCPLCIGNHLKKKTKKHEIIFLGNIIPTEEEIEEANENLKKREMITNKIIEKIDNLQKKLISITNRIKQILKEEMIFTSKFINNFDSKFQNYHYLTSFHIISNYISKLQNEKLFNFYNETDFLKQIDTLINISKDIDIKSKKLKEEKIFNSIKKIGDFERFCENPFGEFKFTTFTGLNFCKRDNNFILAYDNCLKFFHLLRNKNIYLDYEYSFKTNINNILLSNNEEELFVAESSYIYIFIYNKKENKYIKPEGDEDNSNNILSYKGSKKFSRIVQLTNGILITISDDAKFYIWVKNEENSSKLKNKKYFVVKVIPSLWGCYEFLQVNEFYFVTLMRDCSLKFFDCEEINEIKTIKIKYGDYLREKFNHIVKINKNYLIVGVKSIYVLISIKTMEIVYYYNFTNLKNIISIHKYDYDNFVLFIGKPNEDENTIYQFKFDDEIKELVEISHFTNKIEKYGDCRYSLINNNMIIRYYYYYASTTNKKFELFC